LDDHVVNLGFEILAGNGALDGQQFGAASGSWRIGRRRPIPIAISSVIVQDILDFVLATARVDPYRH
jgi:hypothetical protein